VACIETQALDGHAKGLGQTVTVGDAARYYADKLRWCVFPIPHGTKKARIKWGKYQATRPDSKQVQKWFGNGQPQNIAVGLGGVSGDLTCRDFDVVDSYTAWAKSHPDLAGVLPTVKTAEGYHVYFQADTDGIKYLGDGELRSSSGYCMLPPSVHPSGATYEWIIPPTAENLLFLDPIEAGFLPEYQGKVTESTEMTENTSPPNMSSVVSVVSVFSVTQEVDKAIRETLPGEYGTRNKKLFEFARTLKSLPQFEDVNPMDLRAIVYEWHRRALPHIRTKEREETWGDFLKAWPQVKYPRGKDVVGLAFDKAKRMEPPKIAVERFPTHKKLQILVAACRNLQQQAAEKPFFLACRTIGRLLDVSHKQAAKWLFLLEAESILEVVKKGGTRDGPRKATRFRYRGD